MCHVITVMPEVDRWLLAYRLLRLCGKHEGRNDAMVALLKARHTCLVMPAEHQLTSEAPISPRGMQHCKQQNAWLL